jgi:hypothetical protein
MENYPIWIRLHPVASDPTLLTAVEARLHDPLWLLGRQWQLGELQHDGGSTPLDVRVEGTSSKLTLLRAPSGATVPLELAAAPLEAIAEREPVLEDGQAALELRAESGLHFLRLLRAATADPAEWLAACAFERPATALDEKTTAFFDLVEGRVPDSTRLLPRVKSALAADHPAKTALASWLAFHETRFEAPPDGARTWDPERLEHTFTVAAPGTQREHVLTVPEHAEGHLDWFTFEAGGSTTPLGATGAPEPRRHFRIPSPLDFAGMPNPRFWTFEDPSARFDALELLEDPEHPPTPATSMVLDFALGYSDDWFLIPIALDAWTVFAPTQVAITDAFGDTHLAAPPAGRWNMFRLDDPTAPNGLSPLFLHAPPASPLGGAPLEELHLLRDELTNVAWAVEKIVPHPLGGGLEQPVTETVRPPPPERGLTWTFAPPSPPRSWFPLIPRTVGRLTLGVLWSARDARPAGEISKELAAPGRRLHQEEVPLSGVQVTRRWQAARGKNGGLHFWIGRAKTPRRTELAPAIRFDAVDG